jgi:hypothetical protein
MGIVDQGKAFCRAPIPIESLMEVLRRKIFSSGKTLLHKLDLVSEDVSVAWAPPYPLYLDASDITLLKVSYHNLGNYFRTNPRGNLFTAAAKSPTCFQKG